MNLDEVFAAIQELAQRLPQLFENVEIQLAFGPGRPAIGDWSNPENRGFLTTGDGIGSKSGIYVFTCSEHKVLYIGKATTSNLHHRVWDHVRTPESPEDGRLTFPNHRFRGVDDGVVHETEVLNGNVRLGVVTVSDPDLVSLIEVYLHTMHKKRHGKLPAFNRQIG